MSDTQGNSGAEDARFRAFREATVSRERDWIAFCEFSEASHNAAVCAAMINLYDGGEHGGRELRHLELAISEMLFRVLPRVELGAILGQVEGIGYAIRYGIIAVSPDALDSIANTEQFEELAAKGYAADQVDTDRRVNEARSQAAVETPDE